METNKKEEPELPKEFFKNFPAFAHKVSNKCTAVGVKDELYEKSRDYIIDVVSDADKVSQAVELIEGNIKEHSIFLRLTIQFLVDLIVTDRNKFIQEQGQTLFKELFEVLGTKEKGADFFKKATAYLVAHTDDAHKRIEAGEDSKTVIE